MKLILGGGKTGQSVAGFYKAQGIETLIYDDQNPIPEIPWDGIDAVIKSPGIPPNHAVLKEAHRLEKPCLSELDLFFESRPGAKAIGITGTNGKSTTTSLVGHILKSCGLDVAVGGNIGIPVLDLPQAQWYVLELSSYQLFSSHPLPFYRAAWTNFSSDHLEYHGTLEDYRGAKEKIWASCPKGFINIDDADSLDVYKRYKEKLIPLSIRDGFLGDYLIQNENLYDQGHLVGSLRDLTHLGGRHNWQNVLMSYALAREFSLEPCQIWEGILTFPGLDHRQQVIRKIQNVIFINDSKATNADSTAYALQRFENIFWIAGGRPKTEGIDSLGVYFPKVKKAYFIGEATDSFSEIFQGFFEKSHTLQQALQQAYQDALAFKEDAFILFSPACASFDQFKNFEHRGVCFMELVKGL